MANIRFISTTTVRPSSSNSRSDHNHDAHNNDSTNRTIELTPWDLRSALHEYPQRGLLFLKPTSLSHSFHDHLKASLSQALDIFYPLAGHLVAVENGDETASFSVVCDGAGVMFVHAAIDGVAVEDIVRSDSAVPDAAVSSFFPMTGVLNCEAAASKLPLLAVQVTELADGGVFVACTMNHCVMDGSSLWHFLNVWSEIACLGGRVSRAAPSFGREYLHGLVDLPIRIPLSMLKISRNRAVPPTIEQRMFRFSRETISGLKAKANAEARTEKISSLQALLAHLWVSVTRCRNPAADEEVNFILIIGMRQRMQPRLLECYFGNSIMRTTAKMTAGELLGVRAGALGRGAQEINRAVAEKDSKEAVKFLQDWARRPVFTQVGSLPPNVLVLGSSPRFDVFGNDFGWGRPVAVRSGPAETFDGKLTVSPGADGGSIDFEICLRPEVLKALASDGEFLGTSG